MLNQLKQEANAAYTENGAVTYLTTGSDCLDFFATVGALRRESDTKIINSFNRAWAENPDLTMKTLFFARDIRGGIGERRVFRVLLNYIGNAYAETARKNIEYIAEYGRFDDMFVLLGTRCKAEVLAFIKKQFDEDMLALENGVNVSLMGKWLPSINTSSKESVRKGKLIAKSLGLSEKQYRKSLTALRSAIGIIEKNLCEKDYSFDYSKQPSKAMLKYRNAFYRNDGERYKAFLDAVSMGEAKINASALLPYEIVNTLLNHWDWVEPDENERRSLDAMWQAQDDFTGGENALVVVDGSGSMYVDLNPMPASVALSLGIYFAERNKGAFHNHFITFSESPYLVEIKGKDISEKVKYCESYNEVANTDILKVFMLILNTAVSNNLKQCELPETLYIISDMEFDWCIYNADSTNFDYAKAEFKAYGYKLPRVVFWNVAYRNRHQPVKMNEQGIALISGANPRVFSYLKAGSITPMELMLETLNSERYKKIVA